MVGQRGDVRACGAAVVDEDEGVAGVGAGGAEAEALEAALLDQPAGGELYRTVGLGIARRARDFGGLFGADHRIVEE